MGSGLRILGYINFQAPTSTFADEALNAGEKTGEVSWPFLRSLRRGAQPVATRW